MSTEKKLTAVEWLVEELLYYVDSGSGKLIIKKAKEMEEKQKNNNKWIDVERDKIMPMPYDVILIQFKKESDGLKPIIKTGYWCGNSFVAHGGNPILTNEVTHWTHLPEPQNY